MALVKSKKPHILVVPYPCQGHVKPLMKLSHQIAKHGIKVTFVIPKSIHQKIVSTSNMIAKEENLVLASIPDGRDGDDIFQQIVALRDTLPGDVTDLIGRINGSDEDAKISCVIADITMAWILETAEKMGAEPVGFSPPPAAALALMRSISKLNLDSDGNVMKGETVTLSEKVPAWKSNEFTWSVPTDLKNQRIFYNTVLNLEKPINQAKLVLGNTFYELEPAACDLNPNFSPIGSFVETNISDYSSSFHLEDDSCISWLDKKSPGSVVYVSFGSLAVFSQLQLDELALGLELSGRAFLWVVRPDLANGSRVVYPDDFLERMEKSGLGKMIEWAPQEEVLSHSSVSCFISHCGWNSTLEGVGNGVPFLCWPYFSDQYHNQSYICDQWQIGLRIDPDENGIRSRYEIKEKISDLISDGKFKKNALKLQEMGLKSVSEGGSSYCNFQTFINHLRKLR